MEANLNTERRQGRRRHADAGPPPGSAERRVNIERRLFNIDFGGLAVGRSDRPAENEQQGRPA